MTELQNNDDQIVNFDAPEQSPDAPKLKLKTEEQLNQTVEETRPKCPKCERLIDKGEKLCSYCGLNLKTGRTVHEEADRRKSQGKVLTFLIIAGVVAAGVYFYMQNKEAVDAKVKETIDKAKPMVEKVTDAASDVTGDVADKVDSAMAEATMPETVKFRLDELKYELADLKDEVTYAQEDFDAIKKDFDLVKADYDKAVAKSKQLFPHYKLEDGYVEMILDKRDVPDGARGPKMMPNKDLIEDAELMKEDVDYQMGELKTAQKALDTAKAAVAAKQAEYDKMIAPYKTITKE